MTEKPATYEELGKVLVDAIDQMEAQRQFTGDLEFVFDIPLSDGTAYRCVVARAAIDKSLAWDVEGDVRANDLTREEQRKVATAALDALRETHHLIPKDSEPVGWRYERGEKIILSEGRGEGMTPSWTETPLYALAKRHD